jgi:hypothetical protein
MYGPLEGEETREIPAKVSRTVHVAATIATLALAPFPARFPSFSDMAWNVRRRFSYQVPDSGLRFQTELFAAL